MAIRRVIADVEMTLCRTTSAGCVHKVSEASVDLTEAVFRLPLRQLKQLRDGERSAMNLAQATLRDRSVTDIRIVKAILDCIGVSRMSAITEDDLWSARIAFGLVRQRHRPIAKRAA